MSTKRFNIDSALYEVISKNMKINNDRTFTDILLKYIPSKITVISCNEIFYIYNEDKTIWEYTSYDDLAYKIIGIMTDLLCEVKGITDDEKIIEKTKDFKIPFNRLVKEAGKVKTYEMALKLFQADIRDTEFIDKVDRYTGKIQFKNCEYDLKTGETRQRTKEDYITTTLKYDFDESKINDDIKKQIKKIFKNIANNSEDEYKSIISWFAYCLNGGNSEQLFGNLYGPLAGNGKSTLIDILREVFPIYTLILGSQTFNKNYSNNHKQLIGIKPFTRICSLEEPDDGEKLNISLLKDFCSASEMAVEVLYGTTKNIKINCIVNFITNYILRFDIDAGIERRGISMDFNNKFINADDMEHYIKKGINKKNLFIKDSNLISKFKTDEFKINLLSIISDVVSEVGYDKIYNLKQLKNKWLESCAINDSFKDFLNENYEITNNQTDLVRKNDFLELYKNHYKLKGQVSLNKLLNHIRKNNLSYNRQKMIDGEKGVIVGIKLKEEEEQEQEQEQDEEIKVIRKYIFKSDDTYKKKYTKALSEIEKLKKQIEYLKANQKPQEKTNIIKEKITVEDKFFDF